MDKATLHSSGFVFLFPFRNNIPYRMLVWFTYMIELLQMIIKVQRKKIVICNLIHATIENDFDCLYLAGPMCPVNLLPFKLPFLIEK